MEVFILTLHLCGIHTRDNKNLRKTMANDFMHIKKTCLFSDKKAVVYPRIAESKRNSVDSLDSIVYLKWNT